MRDISAANFGILVAYILPGFFVVLSTSPFSETLSFWLGKTSACSPSLGGFLFIGLGSLAAGLVASTFRWLILDSIHHRTGIRSVEWDFGKLREGFEAFEFVVESSYRYYQFYGNMLVAVIYCWCCARINNGLGDRLFEPLDAVVALINVVLFLGSRDTLRKYYLRGSQLIEQNRSIIIHPPR